MATVQDAKSAFPRRRRLFRRIAIVAVAVTVFYGVLKFLMQDPEERPPIIVNNGSVVFEPIERPHLPETPLSKVRGQWKQDLTSAKWRHSHGGKPPVYLTVDEIAGSTTPACAAGSAYDASRIDLKYGDGANQTMAIDASGMSVPPFFSKHLKLDFMGATPSLDANGYTMTLPGPVRIMSITILLTSDATQTCDFGDGARFRIRQRR
jgi:hypothetical protein